MAVPVMPGQSTINISLGYLRTKRLLDIIFSLLVLIPLCIVFVIVAVFIRLDSPGPIFYRQKRVGLDGAEFTMLKFRSMYVNNDDTFHRQAIKEYMNGQKLSAANTTHELYKKVDDPRITRVGRF